ncbi:hypothetical protein G3N57_00765 [Paraburkholderia sp. Se-20369]|nr:hypothetical protein [Paraburkholderia sp. Se-20369]
MDDYLAIVLTAKGEECVTLQAYSMEGAKAKLTHMGYRTVVSIVPVVA